MFGGTNTFGSGTGGFGSSNTGNPLLSGGSLFGSSTPQQQPSSGFSSGFSFGQSTAAAPTVNGTTVKFTPLSGSDQAVKNNVTQTVNTLHQCITAMKEYESKSIEELRFEDYQAKRKFAQQTGFGTSLFGGGTQQTTTGGLFGSTGLTQSTSTTGFGGSSNLFGSQAKPTTSLFGQTTTTAAPTTGIFGSTTANKPLFGSTTTTSTTGTGFGSTGFGGFGSSTTTTSAPSSSIFGGGTTSFGTPTQPQSTSIFGTSTTPSSSGGLFGSTGSTFGSTAAGTTGTGLFGQQAKPTGFGGFGATTTTTPASTFNFGGTPTATTTTSTSLFGTTTPTASTVKPTFGGFGSTFGSGTGGFGTSTSAAAPSPFGTTTTTQAQQKPLFSGLGTSTSAIGGFGTQTGTTASPFGGFGSTLGQPASTGLTGFPATSSAQTASPFGSTAGTGFGQATATGLGTGGFGGFGTGLGTSGLGQTTGGLFGSGTTSSFAPGTTGGLPGLSTMSTLGAQAAGVVSPTSQAAKPQLLALTNSPYGSSPLFKNIIDDFNKKDDILKPVNPIAQKTFMSDTTNLVKGGLTQTIKITPKSINVSAITRSNSLFEGLEEDEGEIQCVVPRRSIKKLIIKTRRPSTSNNSITSDKTDFLSETSNIAAKNKEKETQRYLEDSVKYFDKDQLTNDFTNISEDGDHQQNGNGYPESEDRETPVISNHPAGIILNQPDYSTVPTLDELATMVDEKGNCYVDDFAVVREDYGCVIFLGRTNVANLNLDEIVQIRRKEICVYPDDSKKPPVGEGLNKEAEVTLHRVWPIDKNTKRPITDPAKLRNMRYADKVEKKTIEMNAEFIDYSPVTGSWTFRVKHFSIYGLNDDSDEDENGGLNTDDAKNLLKQQQIQLIKQKRLKLAGRKGQLQLNINDNISEDLSTASRKSSIEENQQQQQLYPDLKGLDTLAKQRKLYPNLNNFDTESQISTRQNFINNLDVENKDDSLINNYDEPLQSNGYFNQQQFDERESIYEDEKLGNIEREANELPLLIKQTNTFNSDSRNKNLLNTFFGANLVSAAAATTTTVMDDDLDDYTVRQDTFDSRLKIRLQTAKSKQQQSQARLFSFGLDGNLKGEKKYGEDSLFKDDIEIDQEQHQTDEQKQELFKLKPKLLTRYNRLSIKQTDASTSDDKLIKYKKYLQNNEYFSNTEQHPLKKLKLVSYKCANKQYIPLIESIIRDKLNNIIDLSLFNARRFRINWSHPLKYSCLSLLNIDSSTENDEQVAAAKTAIFSVTSPYLMLQVKQLNMNNNFVLADIDNEIIKHNCVQYLQIQRENSIKKINEQTKVPSFEPIKGNKIIYDFYNATQDMRNNIASHPDADNVDHMNAVWSLCQCLWGDLEELDLLNLREKNSISPYEIHQLRKKALSKWLANVSNNRIEREVKLFKYHKNDDNYLNAIFSLLTGNRILDACNQAVDNNDFRLALLLSQAGSNDSVRNIVKRQINEWYSSETDKYINYDRLKLFILLAGEITFDLSNNKTKINVCENLDWKRQFGLHLWYNKLPVDSIASALQAYEVNVEAQYCKKPYPPYIEDKAEANNKKMIQLNKTTKTEEFFDTCYHLVKLFCDKTHQLADIISPQNHTSNMLDLRLTWHLAMSLLSLDYHHMSLNCIDNLHDNYATQLQTLDLWEWSIFIVLHINDERKREYYVKYYLNKNSTSLVELTEQEKFVNENLSVPITWIYEAKALKAKYDKLIDNEVDLLIKACKWNQAHLLIVDSYGPDCLIKENVEPLEKYLQFLSREVQHIQNWKYGGKIYLDYIKLNKEFESLIKNNKLDEDLFKSMHDKITDLSSSLKNFDYQTTKKKQCCIKISKLLLRLFHIFNETTFNKEINDLDVNIIEKAIQLADTVPEHKIIEDVAILKAKYVYNALKLRHQNLLATSTTNENLNNTTKSYFLETTFVN